GNPIWSKGLSSIRRFNDAHVIITTRDGGFLLGAFSNDKSRVGIEGLWLIRLDSSGKIQWQKLYNVGEPTAITQLSSGDFLVSTQYMSVLRITPTGNVHWQRKYTAAGCCKAGVARPTSDGGFILAGHITRNSKEYIFVAKADSTGKIT